MAKKVSEIKTNIEANAKGFLDAINDIQKSMTLCRTSFKDLNQIMKNTGNTTDELKNQKAILSKELVKTKENLDTLKSSLEKTKKQFGENSEEVVYAQKAVNNAEAAYFNIKNEIDEVNKKLKDQPSLLQKTSENFDKLSITAEKFASKVKWLSAGATSLLGLSAKTAIDFEDAFVGVKKTVSGTDEELEQIRKDIMALSNKIPIATKSLFELAEEAGQLGIETKNIVSFTEIMAKLGTSTNLSATEAGKAIATFVNVMNTLPENYEKIGSVIVQLGNNSKATESDIINMAQRMSGAAATLGMSESSVLGLATALSSVGLEAEMGGTAISRVMNDFNKAANGVETKYGSLSQYAKICGMSTKEFADTVKNNAGEAIKQFVIGLGDTNRTGQSTIQLMSELGINEVRLTDTMLRLANASESVDKYMKMANDEWDINNALNEEASKRYADTASQIDIAKNKMAEISDKMGKILLPIINDGLKYISNLADKFGKLSTNTQKNIVKTIALTAALSPVAKGIQVITKNTSQFIKFLDKTSTPFKTLFTNIKDVNSRTIDLSKNVKESTVSFDKFKNSIKNISSENKNLKSSLTDVSTKVKDTTKQVKEGIDYWHQTASGVDKLKVGITGLVGTAVSLKGFSESIKSISDEGANFGNISATVASGISSIASAATTGASVGGVYGAAIGAIGASIGLVVTGISSWIKANDQSRANLESTKETFSNFKSSIDNVNNSYSQNIKSIQDSTSSHMMYIDKLHTLTNEMAEFIDVNGKVKNSDVERANVIMTLLNESLGTQLYLENGIIKNGNDIISNKEQFIKLTEQSAEHIKKEMLLENFQSQYKEAIDAQTKAKKIYNDTLAEEEKNISNAIKKYQENKISINELEKIVNSSSKAKQSAEKDYQGVLNKTDKIINGLSDVTKIYSSSSATELEKTINKITSSNNNSLDETSKSYKATYNQAKTMAELAREEAKKAYEETKKTFQQPNTLNFGADFTNARYQTNRFVNDYNKAMSNTHKGNAACYTPLLQNIPANEQGTIINRPTLSWVGENGPEAIIPLKNHTEWIDGVSDRIKSSLIDPTGLYNDYSNQLGNAYMNEDYLSKQVELLEKIFNKSSDMYVDGRKLSEVTASSDDVASGNLLEKLKRGWAI